MRGQVMGAGLAMLGWALAACGGDVVVDDAPPGTGSGNGGEFDITALCQLGCACSNCGVGGLEGCVEALEETRRSTELAGCGPQFDAYLQCLGDEAACVGGALETTACEPESQALGSCGF